MATWQYHVALLPRRCIDAGGDPGALYDESSDVSPEWIASETPRVVSRMSTLLPEGSSWSSSITRWGDGDGDLIELSQEGGVVSDLFVRFDQRVPNRPFFEAVVAAADALEPALFDVEHLRIISGDTRALLRAASESTAGRFVRDPFAFLDELSRRSRTT